LLIVIALVVMLYEMSIYVREDVNREIHSILSWKIAQCRSCRI